MVLHISAFGLFALSLFLLAKILRRRKLNLPPGPKPWPIIGNLNLLSSLPHRSLHELSQVYGPLMQLQLGSFPVVVASSVEMAKFFLKTKDVTFASRPKGAIGKYTGYNYSNITWSPYGTYWKQARKICFHELFTSKRLDSYEHIRIEETNSLIKEVYKSSGKPISIRDYVSTSSLNIITRVMLGKNYFDGSDDSIISPNEFKELLSELFKLSAVLNIGDFIPCIDFLDLQGYVKRMKIVSKKLNMFLEHVIDDHEEKKKKKSKSYVTKDMVDDMLELTESPTLETKIDRNGVKAFIQDLLAGGTESSGVIIEWAISELLRKPELFEKANEELDHVIGRSKWITEKCLPRLPYLEAIVKEVMRLYSLAPPLLRLAEDDCKVVGYDIKRGTHIMVNVWTLGRDPSLWEDPDDFRPDRFIGKAIDVKGQDFELLPFGSGRRMCPGYNLGLKLVQLGLANLLHGFNWKLPAEMKPENLSMEEDFALSPPKKVPLDVVAEPRLPIELYSISM